MKIACFIAVVILFSLKGSAQNVLVDTAKTQGKEVLNNATLEQKAGKESSVGMIPAVIIILNYDRVIKPAELAKIDKSDILKQYYIENKLGTGEVEKVMIVETRSKEKYRK